MINRTLGAAATGWTQADKSKGHGNGSFKYRCPGHQIPLVVFVRRMKLRSASVYFTTNSALRFSRTVEPSASARRSIGAMSSVAGAGASGGM